MKQAKSPRGAALAAILIAGTWLAWSCLTTSPANAGELEKCDMDPVKQSICIYQAILADVEKTYPMRGGGGIGSIAQTATTTFRVQLLQEGRIDRLDYTVRIGAGGAVEIVGKKESAQTMGRPE
ncbi:MAG: hypothetical protein LBF93_01295 [Zoogloeaceae bacterium]|jgi:hypothetical protein|nr:hypothetical protein [Zoogloeaceae bacterium]